MVRSRTCRAVVVAAAFSFLCAAMPATPAVVHAAEPPAQESAPESPTPESDAPESDAPERDAPELRADRAAEMPPTQIRNSHSGLCLAVRGDISERQAEQVPCGPWRDQWWIYIGPYIDAQGEENWMIKNDNSKQCLVARGRQPETPVVQSPCNTSFIDQYFFHSRQASGGRTGQIKSYRALDLYCIVVRTKNVNARAVTFNCAPQFEDSLWTRTVPVP
jgi:hypothetical protein